MPKKGYKLTKEHKKNISKAKRGQMMGDNNPSKRPEVRKKMSDTAIRLGRIPPSRLGIPTSKKTKEKQSIAKKGKHYSIATEFKVGKYAGKNHYNWKGGISFEPYSIDWTETLRRAVRERDNYICQLCSRYGNTVHHIDYDKKNCNPENLITLCASCNTKVNFNREYWTKYFTNLISANIKL